MKYCNSRRCRISRSLLVWVGFTIMQVCLPASVVSGFTAPPITSHARQMNGQAIRLGMAASVVSQRGDMTYTIQGSENGGWKSELEWPLETIIYGGGSVSVTAWERVHLNVGGWKSLNEDSGIMKDSDWYDELRPILLLIYGDDTAIYGEFDTTVAALAFDTNLRVDVLPYSAMMFQVMAGYRYGNTRWVAGDGYQRSPLAAYNVGSVTGDGITYEQTITVPYAGLAMSVTPKTPPLDLNLYALYSPFARCEDVDDHLVRSKKSTGLTKGTFFSFGTDLALRVGTAWSLTGTLTYTRYDLDGFQDQVFYGGPNVGTRFSDIDMTVTGSQFAVGFLVSYALR